MTEEERFWAAAQWHRLEDDLPAVGVHPAWQEVLDQRTARCIESQVQQSLADGRRAVREAIGQIVAVDGHRARIKATCPAGVVLQWAAGYRECVPWSDLGRIRAPIGSTLERVLRPEPIAIFGLVMLS